MKLRLPVTLLVGSFLVACAPETDDAAMEDDTMEMASDEMSSTDMSADAAALHSLTDAYVEHYNMGHADVVADLYADEAVQLLADGAVNEGKEAIRADLAESLAISPTLAVEIDDQKVAGDMAVAHGTWNIDAEPEGADPLSMGGHWLGAYQRADDGWKVLYLITNYDAEPPAGITPGSAPDEPPADEGTLTELVSQWQTHYNMGHASVVADLYAEDAVVAFSNQPAVTGRAAITAALEASLEGSPELTIHDVGTADLGDGWVLDGGWWEMTTAEGTRTGSYMLVGQRGDEGAVRIHWHVSNEAPSDAM